MQFYFRLHVINSAIQGVKMKKRKYTYWRILQQNCGYGWDDIEHFDLNDSSIKQRKQVMKDYTQNMPQYVYRWIERRELNTKEA